MHNTDQIPDPASTSQALRQRLSASVYYELVHTLGAILPDPPESTEEARFHRIQTAIAKVADLRPVNAEEAEIAANFIACSAQARETQRQACLSPEHFFKLNAQYNHLLRTANSTRNLLLRVQKARLDRERTHADADAWTQHIVLTQLTDALNCMQPAAAAALPEPPPPAEPPPQPANEPPPPAEPPPTATPQSRTQPHTHAPPRDLAAEADDYAILHPKRAQQIRTHRGLPPNCGFGPPDPDLLHAIIHGATPAPKALDPPTAKT